MSANVCQNVDSLIEQKIYMYHSVSEHTSEQS